GARLGLRNARFLAARGTLAALAGPVVADLEPLAATRARKGDHRGTRGVTVPSKGSLKLSHAPGNCQGAGSSPSPTAGQIAVTLYGLRNGTRFANTGFAFCHRLCLRPG